MIKPKKRISFVLCALMLFAVLVPETGAENVVGAEIGKIISYDSFDEKTAGTMPGTSLTSGGCGWIHYSKATYGYYKNVDDNIVMSINTTDGGTATNQVFYSLDSTYDSTNKRNDYEGYTGKFTVEMKLRTDSVYTAELRLRSTYDNGTKMTDGFVAGTHVVYGFLTFNGENVSFDNYVRKADNSSDEKECGGSAALGLNEWAVMRFEIDTADEEYDLYINNTLVLEKASFSYKNIADGQRPTGLQKANLNVAHVYLTNTYQSAGELLIDDIAVYDRSEGAETYYLGELDDSETLNYTCAVGDTLSDRTAKFKVVNASGADTGFVYKAPVRLSRLNSEKAGVRLATIDYSDKTAKLGIRKMKVTQEAYSWTQDFSNYTPGSTITNHTVTSDTDSDDKFLRIVGTSTIYDSVGLPKSLDLGGSFDVSFQVRFKDITNMSWSANSNELTGYFGLQLLGNNKSMAIYFSPESKNAKYCIFNSSSNQSLFNSSKNQLLQNIDTTKWYTMKLHFENHVLSGTWDGTNVTFGGNNGATTVSLDTQVANIDTIKLAQRGSSTRTNGTTDIDNITVTVDEKKEAIEAEAIGEQTCTRLAGSDYLPTEAVGYLTDDTEVSYPIIKTVKKTSDTYKATVLGYDGEETVTLAVKEVDEAFDVWSEGKANGMAKIGVGKMVDSETSATLIVASYDEDERLKRLSVNPISQTTYLNVPLDTAGTLKAFVWNSLTELKPICEGVEIEILTEDLTLSSYDIVCWGDSLTYGAVNGAQGQDYPTVLSSLLGESKTVRNMGIGGETAQTIAARQGGLLTAPTGAFSLGAEQGATVTFTGEQFCDLTGGKIVPRAYTGTRYGWDGVCYLKGIPVKVTALDVDDSVTPRVLNSITFTRQEAGDVLSVFEGERASLVSSGSFVKGDINVIFIGQNGWHDADGNGTINEYDLRDIINEMIANTPNPERTIIIGLATGTAASRANLEMLMEQSYGERYINLREYVSNETNLTEAGITPTTDDEAAIAEGSMPKSLWSSESDNVHFNAVGYQMIAEKVYQTMQDLGFVE